MRSGRTGLDAERLGRARGDRVLDRIEQFRRDLGAAEQYLSVVLALVEDFGLGESALAGSDALLMIGDYSHDEILPG
jgi:hypothetical protein